MKKALPDAVRTADSHILFLLHERLKECGGPDELRRQLAKAIPPSAAVDLTGLDEAGQEKRVKENIGLHLRQYLAGTDDSLSLEETTFLASLFGFAAGEGDDRFPAGARAAFPFDDQGRERQLKGFVLDVRSKDPVLLMVDDDGNVAAVQVKAKAAAVTAGPYTPEPQAGGR